MTSTSADQAVVISALIVSGTYFYRKLTEPAIPAKSGNQVTNLGQVPLARFIVGFGVSFFGISVLASLSPDFGGTMAILLATGTLLTNGLALSADVNQKVAK